MNRPLIVLTGLITLLSGALAHAQETPNITLVKVSDVSIVDVAYTEANGKITGNFNLQGQMGQQNDISYGVIAKDEKGETIAATQLGEGISIRQSELRPFSFSYTEPTYLKGAVTFFIQAQTSRGLPLSTHKILSKAFTGSGSTFSCTSVLTKFTCISSTKENLEVIYHKTSLFGPVAKKETISLDKGVKKTLVPDLPAGRYTAYVSGTNGGSSFTLRMPGAFAAIQSVVVERETEGSLSIVTTASYSASIGNTVEVALTDEKNTSCGTRQAALDRGVATLDMKSACSNGTLTVTLKDSSGATLDNLSETFNVVPVEAPGTTSGTNKSASMILITLFGLLCVMAAVYLYRSQKKATAVIFALIFSTLASLGGAPSAHAEGYVLWYNCDPNVGCPEASNIFVEGELDKSSYVAGDPIIFSVYMVSDDYPQPPAPIPGISPYAQGMINNVPPWSADLFPSLYTQTDLRNGISASLTLGSAPAASGFVTTRYGSGGYQFAGGGIPFTIAAAATPSVNIYFQ